MPTSTYTQAPIYVQRLGRHHFAHLRAFAQGVSVTDSAKRYLGLEAGQHGITAHKQLVERIKAVARRKNEPKWRLIGLVIRVDPADSNRPSLAQFIEDRDLDGWSESEALEFYHEAFPENRKAMRRHRLHIAQLEMLARLESIAAESPLPSDHLSGWFDSVLADRLTAAGYETLEQLMFQISSGGRWYAKLKGIGKTKANHVATYLSCLIPNAGQSISPLFRLEATPTLPNLLTFGSNSVDLEGSGNPPSPLNANPEGGAQIAAKSDLEAIDAWVHAKAGSTATAKAYRREAGRLLLWLRYERNGLTLGRMRVDECLAYMAFLQHVPATWISKRQAAPGTQGWAPFKGQLSNVSRRQSIVILAGLFNWLQSAQYIPSNPWFLVNQDTDVPTGERLPETKALSEAAISEVLRYIRAQAPSPARDRIIFIITFLEAVGLRSSELVRAKLADVQREPEGWIMQVLGKGAKSRIVALPGQAFDAMQTYLEQRGLGGIETAPPEAPLLASTANAMHPIGYQSLYEHVRSWLTKSVAQAELPAHERNRLNRVSTHWLRHTFGTRAVARQVPLDVIQAQMGHSSIQTTISIYGRAPLQRRAEELCKAFG